MDEASDFESEDSEFSSPVMMGAISFDLVLGKRSVSVRFDVAQWISVQTLIKKDEVRVLARGQKWGFLFLIALRLLKFY
ncbi:hypothetical protein AVEN_222978-1 [Araneus ventricosus]|uniref:Uncharacterized protein n=1 Tax=Araneus ventricosus TaxID=182803 RepID=A0A4Y2UEP7_ARAVE|nr:hypothetical protein AVEN_222978-1 [Araneus ventricosus]